MEGRRPPTARFAALCPLYHSLMQITVNGAPRRFDNPLCVAELIEQLGMTGRKIAVERNGEIVPKSAHARTSLSDGDRLEIVVAVGGG